MIDYRKNLHDVARGFPLIEISPVALLTDPQGNLLLVRDHDDVYWHLLGGWLGPDETIRECLQRAVLNNFWTATRTRLMPMARPAAFTNR